MNLQTTRPNTVDVIPMLPEKINKEMMDQAVADNRKGKKQKVVELKAY